MADEAVVRIVVDNKGGAQAGAPSSATPPQSPVQPTAFDPLAIAKKRVEREEQMAAIQTEYDKLKPPTPPPPKPGFDPLEIARKRVEKENQQAAIDAEYAKLKPPAQQPQFDPLDIAKKRLEREKKQQQADEEYAKLNPKGSMDSLLESLTKVRGSIGGLGGGLLGVGLDLMADKDARRAIEGVFGKGGTGDTKQRQEATVGGTDKVESLNKVTQLAGGGKPTTLNAATAGGGSSASAAGSASTAASAGGSAAAMGGAASAAAAALPMVAIAMAVKEAVSQVNAAVIGGLRNVIGGAGALAAGIASADSDPSKPIAALGDAASKTGEKVAEIAPALGYALVAVGETQKAFAGLMKAIDGTTSRYGEYSPAIAQAQAVAEIRQVTGDMRRSREVGVELSKYLIAQSDLQQKFEDIKIKLLSQMLPIVTRGLQVLEAVVPSGEGIETAINGVSTVFSGVPQILMTLIQLLKDDKTPLPEDPTTLLRNSPDFTKPGNGNAGDRGLVPRR